MSSDNLKRCTKCGELKPLSAFGKHRWSKDGHAWQCKACGKQRQEIYRSSPPGIYQTLCGNANFFKRYTVDFTKDEFIEWYNNEPKICAYCDVPQELIHDLTDAWNNRMTRLQVDRIDASLGYSEENVVLSCPRCNMTKSNYFTFDEMREIAQKYIKPRWVALKHHNDA